MTHEIVLLALHSSFNIKTHSPKLLIGVLKPTESQDFHPIEFQFIIIVLLLVPNRKNSRCYLIIDVRVYFLQVYHVTISKSLYFELRDRNLEV